MGENIYGLCFKSVSNTPKAQHVKKMMGNIDY